MPPRRPEKKLRIDSRGISGDDSCDCRLLAPQTATTTRSPIPDCNSIHRSLMLVLSPPPLRHLLVYLLTAGGMAVVPCPHHTPTHSPTHSTCSLQVLCMGQAAAAGPLLLLLPGYTPNGTGGGHEPLANPGCSLSQVAVALTVRPARTSA